jgi:hypothetical protein
LNIEEAAEVLKISRQTAKRDWKIAKAWLRRELERSEARATSAQTGAVC